MSTSQFAAISTNDITSLHFASPIVLDLNGDGVQTTNIKNGVSFDIFGVGKQVTTGWVSANDGLLVLDRNKDGTINGGAELFGQGTTLFTGQKAANGYMALSEIDSNNDHVINSSDVEFNSLKVWVDSNSDGVSQSNELSSLTSMGITNLDIDPTTTTEVNNGNMIGIVSNFTTKDGSVHKMADVWFETDNSLRQNVGNLVDAMNSFTETTSNTQLFTPSPLNNATMNSLVSALTDFDSNGVKLTGTTAVSTNVTLNTSSRETNDVLFTNLPTSS